jgi:membrane-associated phospholipid phosphatase
MFCILLHNIFKEITSGWYPPIFKRPNGATDCSLFNTGGLVDHKSGFPSGHVTAISFLMYSLLLKHSHIGFKNMIQYNIPIVLVAYARIMKGCHNLIQVIAGYLLGYGVAYMLHIYKKEVSIKINEIKTYISEKLS